MRFRYSRQTAAAPAGPLRVEMARRTARSTASTIPVMTGAAITGDPKDSSTTSATWTSLRTQP